MSWTHNLVLFLAIYVPLLVIVLFAFSVRKRERCSTCGKIWERRGYEIHYCEPVRRHQHRVS